MTTVFKNQLAGNRTTETENGYESVQTFKLKDVPGTGEAQEFNALQDAEIPQFGQPHSTIPDIQVTSRSAAGIDNGLMAVEITYARPSFSQAIVPSGGGESASDALISIGAALSSVESNFDIKKNPLIVTFTGTVQDDEGNETEVVSEEQIATASVQIPQTVLQFSRRERSHPARKSQEFVGTVNFTHVGIWGTGTLLCTRIDGVSNDNGLSFDVSYEFQYNPDGWTQDISWIDPQTDRPPVSARLGNGITTFEFYREEEFQFLNLPF